MPISRILVKLTGSSRLISPSAYCSAECFASDIFNILWLRQATEYSQASASYFCGGGVEVFIFDLYICILLCTEKVSHLYRNLEWLQIASSLVANSDSWVLIGLCMWDLATVVPCSCLGQESCSGMQASQVFQEEARIKMSLFFVPHSLEAPCCCAIYCWKACLGADCQQEKENVTFFLSSWNIPV